MISLKSTNRQECNPTNEFLHKKDLLAITFDFCDMETILNLVKVNKKFKNVITLKEKTDFTIFCDFIIQRDISKNFDEARMIFDSYPSNSSNIPYLISLRKELSKKKYTSSQVDHFVNEILKSLLKQLTEDEIIDLRYGGIGKNLDDMKYLCIALKTNTSIKELNLERNYIGQKAGNIQNLSEILNINTTIIKLDLRGNSIGSKSGLIKILSLALKQNTSITSINLQRNEIGENEHDIELLLKALSVNKSIKKLYLGYNYIGSDSYADTDNMRNLCEFIKENKCLTTLYLECNNFGRNDEGMYYFSQALKHNKTLTYLNLTENEIGLKVENVKMFFKGLKANTSIKKLNLFSNLIGTQDENFKYLLKALKTTRLSRH